MLSFDEYMKQSDDSKLKNFMDTLAISNRKPTYYVNWDKVYNNSDKYEYELNALNFLIGKDNIENEATKVFTEHPELLKVMPALIASREADLDVLKIDDEADFSFYNVNFKKIDDTKITEYVDFLSEAGVLNFIQKHAKKSLVDYVYGVEVGIDSNGRKNRSGKQNEEILEINLKKLVKGTNLEWGTQVTADEIKARWNLDVPIDKSTRIYDGVVYNPDNKGITIIETNFYGSGGSKLKSVAGEFTELQALFNTEATETDIRFVWISDGKVGWTTAKKPMAAAFTHIPHIINLAMVDAGYLEAIVKK
ncbi:restriction endonuclease [Periweissella cryptocerci]|uniref:Type-2 restriction enzyme n=1 Tax=Periweissella cryptocerci TaxID=2506420 RepID=A0A4P6YWA3_9LACO|nr:type II restriction endonuclease [Periweissella cryptocerci]QBO37090.1 restriction endonuclease [Periweissella cryptocerci]